MPDIMSGPQNDQEIVPNIRGLNMWKGKMDIRINDSLAKIINISEIFLLKLYIRTTTITTKLYTGTERRWRLILTEQSTEGFLEVKAYELGFEVQF